MTAEVGGAERVGVLGGTFDPVHVAHLVLAVQARHQLGLDRVLFVVANSPWMKAGSRSISPAEDRFAMVAAAVAGQAGLEASRIELDRGGDSYTVDTLEALRAPGRSLYLLVGSDLVAELPRWHRAADLPALCTLAVARRPGAPPAAVPDGWAWHDVRIPSLALSSSELRAMAAEGLPLDHLVPSAALAVARSRGLYRPR